ncbi:MAG TPA: DISARM system phospholipase D-like protein DrmC [Candidatus Competibacter sp.]|uniref:Phospholipase D/Transphosphatidylase n=1 Tax=Candidatus Competibacter denitrificans Run_A_D11 TaxID=1400863 RepID=W6M9Q4_9GAMM|nr:DISARM system phospholipase D-like protein DrmC [Candidatus Competibacter denitrificans]CDI04372.1 Phospholipase D/Transphosphatidylase [Candidatus Competibacter denitrificans Run_A_D11]HRC71942.1 DISARM system phospholipase D-like protein DrmC [Candidatus Competibacter sp.]
MERLLEAVTAVVCLVSPEKVRALAGSIRKIEDAKANVALSDVVGTASAKTVVERLVNAWRATSIGSGELASMLLAASHTFENVSRHQSTELVWTGPTTSFVSARRTEQALLQVIGAAKQTLFVTSFVAYDVSTIVKALNNASERGVGIFILLESSQNHGGSISFDVIGKMRALVPSAKIYAWHKRAEPFVDGRVHSKVAVADGDVCFITSANLTGHAMEQNMEAGVLITGGQIPMLLQDHLQALIDTNIVSLT